MKNYFFLSLFIFLSGEIIGQNLVPNPSFEDAWAFPNAHNEFHFLNNWYNCTDRTPDFFHLEGTSNGRPHNSRWGEQWPHSGRGIIAMHTWTSDEYPEQIEYAQIKLKDTLERHRQYKVQAYINAAEKVSRFTNAHGFLFTKDSFSDVGFILRTPHYYNEKFVYHQRINWTKIEGYFIADEPHQYLTIGNFLGRDEPFRFELNPNAGSETRAATYFWDDVSVTPTNNKLSISCKIVGDCLPVELRLKGNSDFTQGTWDWKTSEGHNFTGGDTSLIIQENGILEITAEFTQKGRTLTFKKKIIVDVAEFPIASFEILPDTFEIEKPIQFQNNSQHAEFFDWDFGNGITSDDFAPEHIYETPGDYTISLIIENEFGCADTTEAQIFVRCNQRILANAFTPNGDGSNDVFPFDGLGFCGEVNIQIFNRWGGKVFETDDPSEPWKGEDVPNGVYFFTVTYRGGHEEGWIEVVK